MTLEQARIEIPDIDTFCKMCCYCCTANDGYYCPSECETLEKARKLDFDRIVKSYARNDGDMIKVDRYIKQTVLTKKNRRQSL